MLTLFPELGEDFGLDDVLTELAQVIWEGDVAGRRELVRRGFGFVEWLAEAGRPDLAIRTVSTLFFDLDASAIERLGMGPRTAQLVVKRDASAEDPAPTTEGPKMT